MPSNRQRRSSTAAVVRERAFRRAHRCSKVRIGDSPLQTVLYDGIQSVVVRQVLSAVGMPIDSLPASIPLAIVGPGGGGW